MIKAIVFDFNGVFANPREKQIMFNACSKLGRNKLLAEIKYYFYMPSLESGSTKDRQFWQNLLGKLSEKQYNELVVKEFQKPFSANKKLYALCKKLSKKFRIHLISNANALQVSAYKKQKLYAPFEKIFLSHETGFVKPNPSAFSDFLKKTGLKARECIFVDDKFLNVLVAKLFGFRGIQFRNDAQFEKELRETI